MTELRRTFDSAAEGYQDARPDYPTELYDDLLAITGLEPPGPLLEVGPGPGKATIPLARKGFSITALELGAALAAEARRRLQDYSNVRVLTTAYEDFVPDEGDEPFAMVYAATAWHWIDPETRYALAARLLRPGGYLAIWGAGHAFPEGFDPFFTRIQQAYEAIGEKHETWPPLPPDRAPNHEPERMTGSGLFEVVASRRYVWALQYDAEAYIALLDTFSGHIAMAPADRERLYAEVRRLLAERPDGLLTRHWISNLTIGRLRNPPPVGSGESVAGSGS